MSKFKVGDRVINISDNTVPIGDRGVVMFTPINGFIGVAWDTFDKGHDFEEQKKPFPYEMKPRHGWYVFPNDIELSGEQEKCYLLSVPINDDHSIKINTNYDINPAEICQSLTSALEQYGIGLTFKNGKTLKAKKEKTPMLNLEFKTEESYRIDKTCNKQISTIKTTVSSRTYPWMDGVATCDKADYEERQGILEALANLICNGNFDREYQRTKAKYKKQYAEDCKCQKCGKSFATPELARECEKAHEERRKARREKYLMRKAAIKRAKEMEIEQMAKDILKEKE